MTQPICRSALSGAVVIASALVAGCGVNPIVSWQAQREPEGQLDTMATARADAASLKRAFNDKAESFVGTKVALNDSLLGLGVLTLGLAVGRVHRDVFTGTAGVAGAAYLFGTNDLQDVTLQAYQSGVGAVNCAEAAVRPLQVTTATIAAVGVMAERLRPALVVLSAALADADNELARSGLEPAQTTVAQQQLDAARAVYVKAKGANADAATLEAAVTKAAGGLKGLLAEIHAAVNKMASKAVVDPASIPKSLESLVKIVAGFGKGLGIDSFLTTRIGAANPAKTEATAQGASAANALAPSGEPLVRALNQLAQAQAQVAVLAEPLAAQLDRYKSYDDSAALAKCGVSDASLLLGVDRELLTFAAKADGDQSKTLAVSGGVKPYTARFRDSPTRGVEVINPLPGDRSIEVRVPKGTEGDLELGLMVTDAASPPQVKMVTVRVAAAASAPSPDRGTGADIAALKAAFQKAADEKEDMLLDANGGAQTNRYRVMAVEPGQDKLTLTLRCTQGTAKSLDAEAGVRLRLIDWLGNERKVSPRPSPAFKEKINLQGGAPCLKP